MLNILCIAIILVFIIDLSGAIESFKKFIWNRIYKGMPYKNIPLKPLECSLCMTWWIGGLYIIFTGHFTLFYLTLVAVVSFMTPVIKDVLIMIKDLFTKGIDYIYNYLKM